MIDGTERKCETPREEGRVCRVQRRVRVYHVRNAIGLALWQRPSLGLLQLVTNDVYFFIQVLRLLLLLSTSHSCSFRSDLRGLQSFGLSFSIEYFSFSSLRYEPLDKTLRVTKKKQFPRKRLLNTYSLWSQ